MMMTTINDGDDGDKFMINRSDDGGDEDRDYGAWR